MNDKVLRKLRMEVELLIFVATMSIVLSAFIILDVSVVFTDFWQYGVLTSLLRICEFVFALGWLLLSIKFSFDVQRLRKRHFRLVWYGFQIGFAPKLEEKRKESEVTEIIRDVVAIYRIYYREVRVILALAIAASFSIISVATYSVLYENLPFWDVFSRWLVNGLLLLGATALYIYIHRNWGEKLSKVKDAEKRLSEMLGGPIAYEIVWKILDYCKEPRRLTHIMQSCNLNKPTAKKYIDLLLLRNMLSINGEYYKTTANGVKYLELIDEVYLKLFY